MISRSRRNGPPRSRNRRIAHLFMLRRTAALILRASVSFQSLERPINRWYCRHAAERRGACAHDSCLHPVGGRAAIGIGHTGSANEPQARPPAASTLASKPLRVPTTFSLRACCTRHTPSNPLLYFQQVGVGLQEVQLALGNGCMAKARYPAQVGPCGARPRANVLRLAGGFRSA